MSTPDEDDHALDHLSNAANRANGRKSSGKLPGWTPDEGDPASRFLLWLNELYSSPDPFIGAERFGTHGDAPIVLIRASGERVRWTHQATLQKPAGLQGVLMSQCGIKPRKLTGHDTMIVAWAITQAAVLCGGVDPLEEVILWWSSYIDSRPTEHANPDDEAEWRKTLIAWQHARHADELRRYDEQRHTFILIDSRDANQYVRRDDFVEHVRTIKAGSVSWPSLNSRLAEVGWQQDRLQRRATPSTMHISARVYVVPPTWPDNA